MKKNTEQTSKTNNKGISKKSKIDKYEKSKPAQLELYELMNPFEKDYSNIVGLYNFMPKYF